MTSEQKRAARTTDSDANKAKTTDTKRSKVDGSTDADKTHQAKANTNKAKASKANTNKAETSKAKTPAKDDSPEVTGTASAPSDRGEKGGESADAAATDEASGNGEIPRTAMRSALEWLGVIAGAFVLAFIVNTFLFQAFWIPSPSMSPTLVRNDRILVNKIANNFSDPDRGEMIVFSRPPDAPGGPDSPKDLIKRVVGLPGETFEIRDNAVFIDGDPLDEPYLMDGIETRPGSGQYSTVVLGENEYMMLGDNRTNSSDSRVWGPLERDEMVGRAFVRFWPISDFDLF